MSAGIAREPSPGGGRAWLRHRWVRRALALGGAAALLAYGRFLEPRWLEVTRHSVGAGLGAPLRLAHVSDLHTRGLGPVERSLVSEIQEAAPDVIVVTGDTTARGGDLREAREVLSRLRAPLGVFLVRGNWEYWQPTPGDRGLYEECGVRFLLNDAAKLREGLWIVGVDDDFAGVPNDERAFAPVPPGAAVLAIFHSPGAFDRLAPRCRVAFAGHTHGGQVRIPFLGPIWTPPGSGRYREGWYSAGSSRLYVSRGIGMSVAPVRLFCRPELAIHELR